MDGKCSGRQVKRKPLMVSQCAHSRPNLNRKTWIQKRSPDDQVLHEQVLQHFSKTIAAKKILDKINHINIFVFLCQSKRLLFLLNEFEN